MKPSHPHGLARICQHILAQSGVENMSYRTLEALINEAESTDDALHKVARMSQVRVRRVNLQGNWWQHGNGILLAFVASTEGYHTEPQPLLLLPDASGGYTACMSEQGRTQPLTETIREQCLPLAYCFYPVLPDAPLSVWDLLRYAFQFIRRDMLIVLLLALLGGLQGIVIPLATGILFEQIIPYEQVNLLWLAAGILLIVVISAGLFQINEGLASLRINGKLQIQLMAATWDRIFNLPVSFFRQETAGDLADRLQQLPSFIHLISQITVSLILLPFFVLANLVVLWWYAPPIALLACGLCGVALIVFVLLTWRWAHWLERIAQSEGAVNSRTLQLFNASDKIQAANREAHALRWWQGEFLQQQAMRHHAGVLNLWMSLLRIGLPLTGSILLFALTARSEQLTLAVFVAVNVAFAQTLAVGIQVSGLLQTWARVGVLWQRLKLLFQAETDIRIDVVSDDPLQGIIALENIWLTYKTNPRPVLRDVSLHIEPGEFVAIVGRFSSGKTSLLRLLMGFEKPSKGKVTLDGHNLQTLNQQAIRRQMGIVLQDGSIMPGTIYSNIAGTEVHPPHSLDDAIAAADLQSDIHALPMELHTYVDEGGNTLSGGQRQRLLIARSLIHDPRILLFDEATSSLDTTTRSHIIRHIAALPVTKIMIAHRESSIAFAERVVVLDKGTICFDGTQAAYQDWRS